MKMKSILGAFFCALFACLAIPANATPPDSPPAPALFVEKMSPDITPALVLDLSAFAPVKYSAAVAMLDVAISNDPIRFHICDARYWRSFEPRATGTGLSIDIRQTANAPPGR